MKYWSRIFLALSLAALPCIAGAANFVEQQQQELHRLQQQWRTINLPPEIKAPDTIVSPYNSGVLGAWIRVHNATIYFKGNVGFHAINLVARLTPKDPDGIVKAGQPDSFTVDVAHGCVIATEKQLTALFNQHILDYSPRPLNDLTITTSPGTLTIHGSIKLWSWFPGFWMPLYLSGPAKINDKGMLVFTPERIDVLQIRTQLLLSAINMPLNLLLSIDSPGVKIVGRKIILDVTQVFPSPHINQTPSSVKILDKGVKLCFNNRPNIHIYPPDWVGDSYIWVQGGDLSAFGKLLVNPIGAILPLHGGTTVFHLRDYLKQIAAGYIKMEDGGALAIYIPSEVPKHYNK